MAFFVAKTSGISVIMNIQKMQMNCFEKSVVVNVERHYFWSLIKGLIIVEPEIGGLTSSY